MDVGGHYIRSRLQPDDSKPGSSITLMNFVMISISMCAMMVAYCLHEYEAVSSSTVNIVDTLHSRYAVFFSYGASQSVATVSSAFALAGSNQYETLQARSVEEGTNVQVRYDHIRKSATSWKMENMRTHFAF
jgi:hypothetical protein